MLLLNREGSFRTEGSLDGKLPAGNHRQFRCYCPLVAITPSVSEGTAAVKQESIPWQSFVFDAAWSSTIRNTSLGPCVFQGLGDGDFNFLIQTLQPKCAYSPPATARAQSEPPR
jgi:hypothetical protein